MDLYTPQYYSIKQVEEKCFSLLQELHNQPIINEGKTKKYKFFSTDYACSRATEILCNATRKNLHSNQRWNIQSIGDGSHHINLIESTPTTNGLKKTISNNPRKRECSLIKLKKNISEIIQETKKNWTFVPLEESIVIPYVTPEPEPELSWPLFTKVENFKDEDTLWRAFIKLTGLRTLVSCYTKPTENNDERLICLWINPTHIKQIMKILELEIS